MTLPETQIYVQFGKVEARDLPATADRPATTLHSQKAYLVRPPTEDEPFELRTPFSVNIDGPEAAYDSGVKYGFSFEHFGVGKFSRLEFNTYAQFQRLEAVAPAKVSAVK